jgi:hypothetical protein
MKNKYYIATLSATVLTCAMAHAGDTLATAPTPSSPTAGFSPYLGVSGVYNELTFGGFGEGGGSITEDTTGFKLVGGFDLSHGFSVNGSFERTVGSLSFGEGEFASDSDLIFTDTRLIVNYTQELQQGLSLVGGLGYGYYGLEFTGIGGTQTISTEGLMAEVGIKYQSGQFFGGLEYNHLFAMHTAPSFLLEDEDLGFIEAYLGYQINENVAATLSVETQVVGDSAIEKDLGIALGLQYSF